MTTIKPEFAVALVKALADIGAATKNANNPHFRSKYADLATIIETVKPPLAANGLGFIQMVSDRDRGVAVETFVVHDSGEMIGFGLQVYALR